MRNQTHHSETWASKVPVCAGGELPAMLASSHPSERYECRIANFKILGAQLHPSLRPLLPFGGTVISTKTGNMLLYSDPMSIDQRIEF
jgi:hypothetical protein